MTTDLAAIAQQMAGSGGSRAQLIEQLIRMQAEESEKNDSRARRKRKRQLERRALEVLHERNREIAAALGACPCFGAKRCPRCRGAGAPGWVAPDEELFLEYVGPVLAAMGILTADSDDSQAFGPVAAGHQHPITTTEVEKDDER